MKVLIVDNEPALREALEALLEEFCPEVGSIASVGSISAALELLPVFQPDLLLLDVELDEGTGFDLLRQVRQINFQVVFITAHNRYALDAFRVSALDYLLKPVEPLDLVQSIQKAHKNLQNNNLISQLDALLARVNHLQGHQDQRIALKDAERIYYVCPSAISHCAADGTYTRFYLSEGRCITVSKNLKEYAQILEPLGFLRTHHSFLVNRAKIVRFEKNSECLVLEGNHIVPLSHRKKDWILRMLEH
jgi:two-component system LytT family response regulator